MLSKIDQLSFVNQRNAFFLLLAMHLAGIFGLYFSETRELFQTLTPFNLLATAAIVLHFEEFKTPRYSLFIAITFLVGFFAEVIGVKTGVLFGEYYYGKTLGLKLFEVPLAIGHNWVIMVYGSNLLARKISQNRTIIVLIGAATMTLIDVIIEPVAIKLDFWTWTENEIPLQNYLGWFLLSVLLQICMTFLMPKSNNWLAIRLLYILILFFGLLNIIQIS